MPIVKILRRRGRPRQVVVQLTDRCNARCFQCGMNVANGGSRGDLDRDVARRVIDHCAALGVSALSFTGGEPLLAGGLLFELLDYAGRAGIEYLRTGTNGYRFARPDAPGFMEGAARLAASLAATPVRNFWISLDSADPGVHEANRGFPGMVEGIARALPLFHEHGLYPTANLALTRLMTGANPLEADEPAGFYEQAREGLSRFFAAAADLGFTMANCCYPMSDDDAAKGTTAAYAATASDRRVSFADWEKRELFKALYDTVPRHRGDLRIFTPRTAVAALVRRYGGEAKADRPCLGGVSFFYVDRRGDCFPCGYRGGENLGPFWRLAREQLDGQAFCRACDWECFRDPTELLGPLGDLAAGLAGWRHLLGLGLANLGEWAADLRYFAACGQFDGRRPPDAGRLAAYRRPA
mgnify:CR=1 FL=1